VMQCLFISTHDVDMRDDGVWKIDCVLGLCSFISIGGQYPLED
jgi:hypothetical protein